MDKEFVPCEQALALIKELGFNEPCFGSYVKLTETQTAFFMNDVVSEIDIETPLHESLITKAPLYQQAFRWLLEKHNLYGIIIPTVTMAWTFKTMTIVQGMVEVPPYNHVDSCDYSSREEAELACLKKLIEIVKQKL